MMEFNPTIIKHENLKSSGKWLELENFILSDTLDKYCMLLSFISRS